MVRFSQSISIKAPLERVFEVISDFEHYADFLKGIESTEVLSSGKSKQRVKFALNLMTKIHYTLEFKLSPPDSITWTFVEGEFMKDNSGSWKLKQLDKGVTDATFTTDIEFPFWVPKSMAESTLSAEMPKMLEGFKKESERRR